MRIPSMTLLLPGKILVCMVLLCFLDVPAFAQYGTNPFAASESFSTRMRGGSQSIPLLQLPANLDKSREAWDHSLGGISGSSFDTQVATADQARRAQVRESSAEVFYAPSVYQVYSLGSFSAPSEINTQVGSFEQHFLTPTLQVDDSYRSYAPKFDRAFRMTGGRRRSRILDSLFTNTDQ